MLDYMPVCFYTFLMTILVLVYPVIDHCFSNDREIRNNVYDSLSIFAVQT